jgi:hypothetical protein
MHEMNVWRKLEGSPEPGLPELPRLPVDIKQLEKQNSAPHLDVEPRSIIRKRCVLAVVFSFGCLISFRELLERHEAACC